LRIDVLPLETTMRNRVSRFGIALALVAVGLVSTAAEARSFRPGGFNNGPIIITGPIECEKKLVKKCRWEGDRHICEWVPSTECEIY
jgi:hypothetical protein